MHILLFFLLIFVVIIIVGLSIVGAVLRAIFGIGRRSSRRNNTNAPTQDSYNPYDSAQNSDTNNEAASDEKHKKIFAKDEGEYVDFEEVK